VPLLGCAEGAGRSPLFSALREHSPAQTSTSWDGLEPVYLHVSICNVNIYIIKILQSVWCLPAAAGLARTRECWGRSHLSPRSVCCSIAPSHGLSSRREDQAVTVVLACSTTCFFFPPHQMTVVSFNSDDSLIKNCHLKKFILWTLQMKGKGVRDDKQ